MNYTIHQGDALQVMRGLPSGSVQMCCTSPPYYGLRDYSTATWEGGDPDCDHQVGRFTTPASNKQRSNNGSGTLQAKDTCPKCGARRIDQQIGLESTVEAYVARLVEVFREVRRLLHPTGVLWLNLGDSYNGSGGSTTTTNFGKQYDGHSGSFTCQPRNVAGLGPKQLLGIPWRVAFALQADGWILRSEIIWHKRAPMPESVTDRPTKAHEQVFLLAKNATYYYDADAIREPNKPESLQRWHGEKTPSTQGRNDPAISPQGINTLHKIKTGDILNPAGANRRSVWTLGPESYADAHFATFPTKLVEPMILAGSSAHGCCAKCGAPWERVVERTKYEPEEVAIGVRNVDDSRGDKTRKLSGKGYNDSVRTLGESWQPTCTCNADVVPSTVLDPFSGAATTGIVALKHHRRYIGIELNEEYIKLSETRLGRVQPTLLEVT